MAKRIAKSRAGQSITELAIAMPILLLLLLGTVDLGRVYFAYMTLVNTAREGARYGAEHPQASDIPTHARNEAQGSSVNPAQININVGFPNGCAGGDPVVVNVSYNFQLISAYLFGGTTLPIQTSAQMAIWGQCP